MKPRLEPGFRSFVGDRLLLLERRRRLAFRQIGRDRCFVGAQVAEQRASVRESDLPQASGRWQYWCGDDWTDHRRRDDRSDDWHGIAAKMRTAVERVAPAEARTNAPAPIVAINRAWEGDEAAVEDEALIDDDTTFVEAGVHGASDAADMGAVEVSAAAGAGIGIRWREHAEADGGRSGDGKCR